MMLAYPQDASPDPRAQRPGRDDGHKMVRRVADLAEKWVAGRYRVFGACEKTQAPTYPKVPPAVP
jgi:hypothetical protein